MGAVPPLASRAPFEFARLADALVSASRAAINAATFTPLFTAIFVSAIAISIIIPGESLPAQDRSRLVLLCWALVSRTGPPVQKQRK